MLGGLIPILLLFSFEILWKYNLDLDMARALSVNNLDLFGLANVWDKLQAGWRGGVGLFGCRKFL